MIRRAHPTRFDRLTENGRTQPIRIAVMTDDGKEHDVVLKPSFGNECSVEGSLNEMLGALLAADLGLPVSEPFLVELNPDFVSGIADAGTRVRLLSSNPIAFASESAGRQWRRWGANDKISTLQVPLALSVLGFDAFIGNTDRSPSNSNMLVKDQDWRLIDHEGAFGFRMKLFPPCAPWAVGNLELVKRYGENSEHIFSRQLSGRTDLDFDTLRAEWSGLSNERFAQYDALLPEEWEEVRPLLLDAVSHLKRVRDQIDNCVTELKRVLS